MKRLFLILVLCGLALASSAQAATQYVHVVNQTGHPLKNLAVIERAIMVQVNRQLRPWWHTSTLRFGDSGWNVFVQPAGHLHDPYDVPLPAEANGEHSLADGQPYAVAATTGNLGVFSQNLDHELIEMLVDPSGWADIGGWVLEVCDPVTNDHYFLPGYRPIGYVRLADFVTPRWYFDRARGRYDQDKVASGPHDYSYGYAYKLAPDGSAVIVGAN